MCSAFRYLLQALYFKTGTLNRVLGVYKFQMIFGSTGNFVCTIDYRVVSLEKIKFSHTTIDDVLEVADSYSFPPFICLK